MKYYIDGNNVGGWKQTPSKKLVLSVVLHLCLELQKRGHEFVCWFDSSAHKSTDQENGSQIFKQLTKDQRRFQVAKATKETEADMGILDGLTIDRKFNISSSFITGDSYAKYLYESHDKYKPKYSKYAWIKEHPENRITGDVHIVDAKTDYLVIVDPTERLDIEGPIEHNIDKLLLALGISLEEEKPQEHKSPDSSTNRIAPILKVKEEETLRKNSEGVSFENNSIRQSKLDPIPKPMPKPDPHRNVIWIGGISFMLILLGFVFFATRGPSPIQRKKPSSQQEFQPVENSYSQPTQSESAVPSPGKEEYVEPVSSVTTQQEDREKEIAVEIPIPQTTNPTNDGMNNEVRYATSDRAISATSDNDPYPNSIQTIEPVYINQPPEGTANNIEKNGSSQNVIRTNSTLKGTFAGDLVIESGVTVTLGTDVIIKGTLYMNKGAKVYNYGIIRGDVRCEEAKFEQVGGSVYGVIHSRYGD